MKSLFTVLRHQIPLFQVACALPMITHSFDWKAWVLKVKLVYTRSGPEVIKVFPCSTQLSMKFQLVTKWKCGRMNTFLAFKLYPV